MLDRLTLLELIADVANKDKLTFPMRSSEERDIILSYLSAVLSMIEYIKAKEEEENAKRD